MKKAIRERVVYHQNGLYIYILFPIAVSFLLTFIGARILNNLWPNIYIPWPVDAHVHHYAYGFFVLAASGYLALVFSGPRSKFWISLLHGFGLGLAFDEYGYWLNLKDDELIRWEYDGLLVVLGTMLLILSAKPGIQMIKNHFPFRHKSPPKIPETPES